jgi:hypothetical protein
MGLFVGLVTLGVCPIPINASHCTDASCLPAVIPFQSLIPTLITTPFLRDATLDTGPDFFLDFLDFFLEFWAVTRR